MKTFLFILISISLLFYAGDIFSQSEEICHTWLNAKYNTGDKPPKIMFNYDGTFATYGSETSTDALIRGVFQIEKKWTDADGNIWYKIKMLDMYGAKFKLAMISSDGKTLEFVCQPYKYPTEIKKDEATYCSYILASM